MKNETQIHTYKFVKIRFKKEGENKTKKNENRILVKSQHLVKMCFF